MGIPANLEKVLADFANDDKQAFDKLYHLYFPKLYYYSKSFLKIDEGIEDILQEVFVKLWMNRRNIKRAETFNAFLYTITKNTLLNEIRSRIKTSEFQIKHYHQSVAEEFVTQNTVEFADMKHHIEQFVQLLPTKRQNVYRLSREEGLSNAEIAEQLGISVKTVEDHMTQALKFLKEKFKSLGFSFLLFTYLFL